MFLASHELSPGKPIELSAGPLSLLYENGYVRAVYFGGSEVVRRIYMALRDEYWNTIPGEPDDVLVGRNDGFFSLSFNSRHVKGDIDFLWHGEIKGLASGELTFAMHGTALSGFRRNRIGLCVLHSLSACKGRPCRIETVDGAVLNASFPETIAPYRIFKNMRALFCPVTDELKVTVRFEGDVFETEDQRNWTDAGYKTYSTPLSLPVPVFVEKGTVIDQKIIVLPYKPTAPVSLVRLSSKPAPVTVAFGKTPPSNTLPSIGAIGPPPEPSRTADPFLRPSSFSHLRVDVRLETDDIGSRLAHAERLHRKHAVPIELALNFTNEYCTEVVSLARLFKNHPFAIARFLVYRNTERSTSASTIIAVKDSLRSMAPAAPVVSGTNGHFVEINRVHPPVDLLDGVCFSATPQVHTFDDTSIMENLQGLLETVSAAHALAGNKTIALSPLTLRPRKSPDLPLKDGGPDGRMQTLFGAAWTLGAIAICVEGKVSSLTLDEISPASPVAVLLSWVLDRPRKRIPAMQSGTSDPTRILGIELVRNNRSTAIAANLTNENMQTFFSGLPENCRYCILDNVSFKEIARQRGVEKTITMKALSRVNETVSLTLPPYALVRFEELPQNYIPSKPFIPILSAST